MNNSIFGKTMENICNHQDIRLLKKEKKCIKLTIKSNFKIGKKCSENLMRMAMGKIKIKMMKPIMMETIKFMYFWLNYLRKIIIQKEF